MVEGDALELMKWPRKSIPDSAQDIMEFWWSAVGTVHTAIAHYQRLGGVNNRQLFLIVWRLGSPGSRCWQTPCLVCRWLSSLVSSGSREQRTRSRFRIALLIGALIPFIGLHPPNLIASQRSHLLTPHWWAAVNHWSPTALQLTAQDFSFPTACASSSLSQPCDTYAFMLTPTIVPLCLVTSPPYWIMTCSLNL